MELLQDKPVSFSVEEALALVLAHIRRMPSEQVGIVESYDRILAQDVISDIDLCPFDNAGMDGYAVHFADLEKAQLTLGRALKLKVVGIIAAGEVYEGNLQKGKALRIMTGAPIPPGADTVIKIEDVIVLGESPKRPEGSEILVSLMPKYRSHVRFKGEEARRGEAVLMAGERIGAPAAGLLASTGNVTVNVYGRPRVAIISTGSELVSVSETPGPGQIRNSNSYSLAASVIESGGIPTILPTVKDRLDALCNALKHAASSYDFVITSGGASDGDFDFAAAAVQELGEVFFSKVNIKPGKSLVFGLIDDALIFGLPGNPGAASVSFELFVRPALLKAQGATILERPITRAALTQDIPKKPDHRRVYLRAFLERAKPGEPAAETVGGPAETLVDGMAGEPAGKPAESLAKGPAGELAGEPAGRPAETLVDGSAGEPAGRPAESLAEGQTGNSTGRSTESSYGGYIVTPDTHQSSALLGALNRSNCLVIIPEGQGPFSAGDTVDCLRLDMKEGTVS